MEPVTRQTRARRATTIYEILDCREIEVRDRDDPEWLADHPAGFSAVCPRLPLYYNVSARRLADLTSHLDDDRLIDVLDGIHAWWNYSTTDVMLKYPVDVIGDNFVAAEPEAAAALLELASARRIHRERLFMP